MLTSRLLTPGSSRPASTSASRCRPVQLSTTTRTAAVPRTPRPSQTSSRSQTIRCSVAEQATSPAPASLKDSVLTPIMHQGELQLHKMANIAGVYAVFSKSGELQYIGLSRKVDASVSNHLQELPELTDSVKFMAVENATKEGLIAVWTAWVEEAVEQTGNIPPGNAPGESRWQSRKAAPLKKEIRLTGGKGITGVTLEQLLDQVVKENKVVAFIKGTRSQPQCGFSHKMLQMLNESKADYEVVNVLDDIHNPGLRDTIKTYSQWPTIPQLYVKGEFVGGADICEQMAGTGELQQLLKS